LAKTIFPSFKIECYFFLPTKIPKTMPDNEVIDAKTSLLHVPNIAKLAISKAVKHAVMPIPNSTKYTTVSSASSKMILLRWKRRLIRARLIRSAIYT
jgi:hypothetical protein